MEIQTSSFGTQTISSDDILLFPKGLIGLEDHTEFKLFHEESENPTVYWLQSVTDADFIMSIIPPAALGLDYEIGLDDGEIDLIKLENSEDAIVVLIVYKQHEQDKSANDLDLKAIVKAPLVINTKTKLGLQKSLPKLDINR
ncbi:MAG: flagellar biosynthesis protein FliW [Gammaproteobacteria bacterium]|nr:MAG: flagellar biosynthesis protein FliW [Gammaproteobacteria bacterium]